MHCSPVEGKLDEGCGDGFLGLGVEASAELECFFAQVQGSSNERPPGLGEGAGL